MNKNILAEINRYREIVGLSIIEEQVKNNIFSFGSLDVEIRNNEIFWRKQTSATSPVQLINLGNQNNIEYDIDSKKVIGDEKGRNNVDVTKYYLEQNGVSEEFYPLQRKVSDYDGFFAISFNQKNERPLISSYILKGPVDKTRAEGFSAGVMSDKENIVGYKKYWCKNQRKGKECYYLELSSGQPASLADGGDAIVTNQRVIEVPFSFTEPFIFDTVDFTPETEQKFQEQVNILKDYLDKISGYKEFLSKNPINVIAYASRDNDPEAKVQGKYSPCNPYGDGTRGQYNVCLSQARADKVVELLSSEFPDLKFTGRGMGETDKFGPAWTKEKPTTPDETQPNRRFEVVIPKFTRVDDVDNT